MKIIHTSDLHIGKIINEFSMLEDQKYILDEFLKIIDKENPKALIIAGDIYDRSIPPVEATQVLNDFLSKVIIDRNIKVLMISGNHDSSERIGFLSGLLEKNGLFIASDELFKKVTIDDVNFYLIPYKDPSYIRHISQNKNIKNHNDSTSYIINKIKENLNKDEINIAVFHGYVSKNDEEVEVSDSERRLSIGGSEIVDVDIFDDFDYVALGHLHKAQKVKKNNIRYSGTLLKYSFSEVNHKKSVTVIDIKKDSVNIKLQEIKPLRDFKVIKGSIDEILENGRNNDLYKDDYIKFVLTNKEKILNPMQKLRSIYKNTMVVEKEVFVSENNETKFVSKENIKTKDELELFKSFYGYINEGDLTEEKLEALKYSIDEVLREEV